MKALKPMTADSTAKPKRGGMRALRASRHKAYYAMRPAITLANKKRTLARHLRHYPEDSQAKALCVERYRDAYAHTAISQMTGKAKAREQARERERLQFARIKHALAQPTAPFEAPPPAYAPFNPRQEDQPQ